MIDSHSMHKIKSELAELDGTCIQVNGIELKPSKCFHVELDPLHVLFNTNCPETLKAKVLSILSKHMPRTKDLGDH